METDFSKGAHADHFTITLDAGIAEVDGQHPELKNALDTKKRFLYKWNNQKGGHAMKGDKLYFSIKDEDGKRVQKTKQYKRGGYGIENYLDNCDW